MGAAIINGLLGLWLMVSPAVLDMNTTTSDNNHIVGPLAITFSVISLWKINKNVIKANIILGVWLLLALFLLYFTDTIAFLSNGICGVLLILLPSVTGNATSDFGGGWRSLFQQDPPHLREAEKRSSASET